MSHVDSLIASPTPPFEGLLPETVLSSVESLGFDCDGRLLALNSYENRVWQVGIEGDAPLIAKFDRPKRLMALMICTSVYRLFT
jgi:Ser/Thr protein kinase RdoA (MazF antagonist)